MPRVAHCRHAHPPRPNPLHPGLNKARKARRAALQRGGRHGAAVQHSNPKGPPIPPHWRVAGHTAKLVRMKMHKILLLAVACTWAMGAAAQWQWIDKDGRKVFSDRPPPADIQEKNILKQPGGSLPARPAPAPAAAAAGDAPTATAPATAAAAAAAPKPAASAAGSGKDKELEEKKAQAEAAEAAKKKAEDEKIAKTKAENCTRARAAKAAFDAGKPITQTNAQGERIFLDGTARAAEAKRIDGIVASDCAR